MTVAEIIEMDQWRGSRHIISNVERIRKLTDEATRLRENLWWKERALRNCQKALARITIQLEAGVFISGQARGQPLTDRRRHRLELDQLSWTAVVRRRQQEVDYVTGELIRIRENELARGRVLLNRVDSTRPTPPLK